MSPFLMESSGRADDIVVEGQGGGWGRGWASSHDCRSAQPHDEDEEWHAVIWVTRKEAKARLCREATEGEETDVWAEAEETRVNGQAIRRRRRDGDG